MQPKVLLFTGPLIYYETLPPEQLNKFLNVGDGRNYLKESEISQQARAEVGIIRAHGNVQQGSLDCPKVAGIHLIANKSFTSDNIIYLQKTLGIKHFYLFSCYSGHLPYHLHLLKNELEDATTITIFAGTKRTYGHINENNIKKLQNFYLAHQNEKIKKIDKQFFIENNLNSPMTSVRCEVSTIEGEKKFTAFKIRGPKTAQEIHDFSNYIFSQKKIKPVIIEDLSLFEEWTAQATKEGSERKVDLKEYSNLAFYDTTIHNKIERMREWIKMGANINKDSTLSYLTDSPFEIASVRGYHEAIKLLLDNGADIHSIPNLLYVVSGHGHYEIIKMLIDAGANIDEIESSQGRTSLHIACLRGHVRIVQLLIDAGAIIHLKDNTGRTALDYAKAQGHQKIAQVLIAHVAQKLSLWMNSAIKGYNQAETA